MSNEENPNGEFVERLRGLMFRLKMNQSQVAEYLGVPQTTVSNWLSGERKPNSSVIRLLDVLGRIEAMAPAIHETFIPKREPRTRSVAL